MIVVLTGENAFALRQALQAVVIAHTEEYGEIAVERIDGEEASFERLQESLTSSPFLAPKKLVVVRAGSANKQFVERAEPLLSGLPETTDAVLVEPKLDKRSSYYKFLKKTYDLREFPQLDEQGLAHWLVQAAKQQAGTLNVGDARFLVERVGADQQLLAGELDKLLAYNPVVTRQSIELLSEPTPQGKIFDLLEAVFAGDMSRALGLYRDQREQKVDPAQIISMMAWQLKVVALIKTAGDRSAQEVASAAKLSPFTVQKSQTIARRLSLDGLKSLVADLLALDVRSKRENIDLDEALQNYLLQVARTSL